MAKTIRRVMTLADYLVIALSPALIMALVGSLVFFLVEVSYSGQYRERLLWVLAWFVFGAVLVARIAIQEGREHAAIFGYVLAGATALVALRYVDQFLVAFVLLAIIWWCAGKLTWDCTLIDDDQDASGEGLLQATRLGMAAQDSSENVPEDGLDASHKRPHAPGLWVAYFSLMALPLFGIGQLLIPVGDTARRSYAFQLLICYVASGLGLLLATSFLGLRRYLRQRNLQMPQAMTVSWLSMGGLLILALLVVALLIPRPEGTYTLTALIDRADQKLQQASRFAQFGNEKTDGSGRPIGNLDPKHAKNGTAESQSKRSSPQGSREGKDRSESPASQRDSSKNQPASAGSQSAPSQNQSSQRDSSADRGSPSKDSPSGKDNTSSGRDNRNSDQPSNSADSPKKQTPASEQSQAQPKSEQTESSPNPSTKATTPQSGWASFLTAIAPLFKWLVYGAMLVLGVILFVLYRDRVLVILSQLWHALLNLFQRQAASPPDQVAMTPPQPPPRPFSSFANPFLSDAHARMSSAALVVFTFEALEAWAREQGKERHTNQTPLEFSQMLSCIVPGLAEEIRQATKLYTNVAYSRGTPKREAVAVLERLWVGLKDTQLARPARKTRTARRQSSK